MFEPFAAVGVAAGLLIGIMAHEIAHHFVADRLGDRTPRLVGRLTLSPAAHADVVGTYVLPGIFTVAVAFGDLPVPPFGWGKRHAIGTHGMPPSKGRAIAIALAGPAATAALAFIAGLIGSGFTGEALAVVYYFALANASLTIFELLPIPGRDGGRVLAALLKPQAAMKVHELAEYHLLFMLVLFLFLQRAAGSMMLVSCRILTPFC